MVSLTARMLQAPLGRARGTTRKLPGGPDCLCARDARQLIGAPLGLMVPDPSMPRLASARAQAHAAAPLLVVCVWQQ